MSFVSRLLREERRFERFTAPPTCSEGRVQLHLHTGIYEPRDGVADCAPGQAEAIRRKTYETALDNDSQFARPLPRFYSFPSFRAEKYRSASGTASVVGAEILASQKSSGLAFASRGIIDALRVSTAIVVAFCVKVLLAVCRKLVGPEQLARWEDVCHLDKELGWDGVKTAPFCRTERDGFRHNFTDRSTPFLSMRSMSLKIGSGLNSFSQDHAAANGHFASNLWQDFDRYGQVCEVATLGYLEPQDGDFQNKELCGDDYWTCLFTQLRGSISDRINNLVSSESPRQVASAIHDAHNLDWFKDLHEALPETLGTRGVKMHIASLVATENATYISSRGNVTCFALNAEGLQSLEFGSRRPPNLFCHGQKSYEGPNEVLKIPHVENEGTIFVLASPNFVAGLDPKEGKKLFRWASSVNAVGSEPNIVTKGELLGSLGNDYGALFFRTSRTAR